MSAELEQARLIAERIARRVSGKPGSQSAARPAAFGAEVSGELAAMRAGLNDLQKRLAQIEEKVRLEPEEAANGDLVFSQPEPRRTDTPIPLTHSPWLAGVNATITHPSQERFGVEEATVSELVDFFEKEKICSVEPGGKPCDHCAMCSARGL